MEPFIKLTAIAAPLVRPNIDTDIIIPSREMKRVSKKGLGEAAFSGWRYKVLGGRDENPDFILNQEPFREARILLGGDNFGCGSSREHAVWALHEFGIRVIMAPSFSSIFYNNCVRNGIVAIALDPDIVDAMAPCASAGAEITVDLEAMTVSAPGLDTVSFDFDPAHRDILLKGLDPVSMTLSQISEIEAWEQKAKAEKPWSFL